MSSIDPVTLEQVLAAVTVRAGGAHRVELPHSGVLPLTEGVLSFVHVVAGAVRGHPPLSIGCTLDVNRETNAISVSPAAPGTLTAGGALLTMGDESVLLNAPNGATLIIGEVHLVDPLSLRGIVPGFVVVPAFDRLEPAAAALAAQLGGESGGKVRRSGDPVICRMMATTVLLSVIRAWAENGCAPADWPTRTRDPYLDRVVKAIHAAPGREWTVESLAGIGAMSRSVFAERFRAIVGQSPASYVTEVRMDAAKAMLDAGSSVSEAARELGYASDEGFSRAFRRHTGNTPSLWRTARASLPA